MKTIFLLLTLLPATVFAKGARMDAYEINSIIHSSLRVESGQTVLTYQLPPETLFNAPGVIKIQLEKRTAYKVVRCPIHAKCDVDIKSKYIDGYHFVLLPKDTPSKITIVDNKNVALKVGIRKDS